VRDGQGRHVGLWYFDPFARRGKRSGAWMSAYRSQERLDGAAAAIVSNNCNFVKPAPGKPATISWEDATTLFHEFGHALHQMLSDVTYPSISGTSVAGDFGELPSQLYEHWLEVPEVPFTGDGGGVAGAAERLREGGLLQRQPVLGPRADDADLQAVADRVSAGEEGGPRRRADGQDVELLQLGTGGGEPIEVRCRDVPAVPADVRPAEVVCEEIDHVRPRGGRVRGEERGEDGEREDELGQVA
jgi:hypothetical protein